MNPNPLAPLPAKNFVFPVLRPLITILKCLKARVEFAAGSRPPVVLNRESLCNAEYLSKVLAELCRRGGIDPAECAPLVDRLQDHGLWKSHPVDASAFERLIGDLEAFCLKHKSALQGAYRQDKDYFSRLYRDSVLKRKVLVIHGPSDSPDVLKETLAAGGLYDVDTREAGRTVENSARHHVTLFMCTDSREAADFLVRRAGLRVDVFLTELGRELPIMNMNLCRLVNQAQRSGVRFVGAPYVTMKILPAVEEVYIRRLAELDRAIAAQEAAAAREEDVLVQGVENAMLYAELIVESAWQKTAGFSLERSLH